MGAISEALGQGADFEFQGKKYTLAPWGVQIQGLFEKYLEGEIVAGARRMAALLPPDEGTAVLARTAEKIGLKRYTFGTPEVGEALRSPVHMKYMFFLMLKKNHADVTRDLVDDMAKECWQDMMDASDRANGYDPNAQAPEATTETKTSESPSAGA